MNGNTNYLYAFGILYNYFFFSLSPYQNAMIFLRILRKLSNARFKKLGIGDIR